tara:strand:+ start:14163 stop:14447 length:285 start_codon:yes stop_codon:yes gene_type:complete
MKIFPKNPKLTDKDRARLDGEGYLQSWNKFVARINNVDLSQDDLKRLVFMELEQEAPRKAILAKLLVRIQKNEREDIFALIRKTPGGKTLNSLL